MPAGYQQLRVFKESLDALPKGVEQVFHRSDSAGYQIDLLKYCAEGRSERFGVIEFAIAADVTDSFKEAVAEVPDADWHALYRTYDDGMRIELDQQWAEVCYVPNWAGHSKKGPAYRFVAIREPLRQLEIPGTINLPGRIIHHARQLVVRLTKNHPSNAILITARQRILMLAYQPSG